MESRVQRTIQGEETTQDSTGRADYTGQYREIRQYRMLFVMVTEL